MSIPNYLLRATVNLSGGARFASLRRRGGIVFHAAKRSSEVLPISQRFLATETKGSIESEKQPAATAAVASTTREPSLGDHNTTKTSTSTEAAAGAAEDLLDASFAEKLRSKTKCRNQSGGGLFPWRSSPDLLERLVPGTDENLAKGLLLGGDLTSSNPQMDAFATAVFFLRVPFWDLLLFRGTIEQDLADSMAWAFGAAVREITTGTKRTMESEENDNGTGTAEETDANDVSFPRLHDMMEEQKLAKLFESVTEFGRDSLEVKLKTEPILYNKSNYVDDDDDSTEGRGSENGSDTNAPGEGGDAMNDLPAGLGDGPKIVSLFVFPFLSRDQIANNRNPHHLLKYSKLLDAISGSHDENQEEADSSYAKSLELSRELMEDFRQQGTSENTVICQVLVPCLETFWVKDKKTGKILQGDAKQRKVIHLVRFEQVTKTHLDPDSSRFFPFQHELGEWKITDIDDLCDGNPLL